MNIGQVYTQILFVFFFPSLYVNVDWVYACVFTKTSVSFMPESIHECQLGLCSSQYENVGYIYMNTDWIYTYVYMRMLVGFMPESIHANILQVYT